MNFIKLSLTIFFIFFLSYSNASEEDAIKERISPVGQVCIEGQECALDSSPKEASSSDGRLGKEVYEGTCATCHEIGLAGAPKFGDRLSWGEIPNEEVSHLVETVTNGLNGMPPMGMCFDCSDEELSRAVQYMLDSLN